MYMHTIHTETKKTLGETETRERGGGIASDFRSGQAIPMLNQKTNWPLHTALECTVPWSGGPESSRKRQQPISNESNSVRTCAKRVFR